MLQCSAHFHSNREASSSTQRHCYTSLLNAHGGCSHLCGKRESFHFHQTWRDARTLSPGEWVQDHELSLGAAKLAWVSGGPLHSECLCVSLTTVPGEYWERCTCFSDRMNKKVMAPPLCSVNTCCLHLKVNIWPQSDLDDVLWFSLK